MESIFGNGSSASTTRWEPEPTRRGTYGILASCLITLGLCVWTAVHLNLPARDERPRGLAEKRWLWRQVNWPGQTLRKILWTGCGLLAPELVAVTAYRQYKDAISLCRAMTDILGGGDPEVGEGARKNDWTLTHSYFAVMGGFEVIVDKNKAIFPTRPDQTERTTLRLTPEGLCILAKTNASLIPDIPIQQIQDKSKGSSFAKTIVCFQASWFCIQCLTRFGQRLGVSLLELNTFAHAICALVIYIAWWKKPLDVEQPVTLAVASELEYQVLAMMCCDPKLDRKMKTQQPAHFAKGAKDNRSRGKLGNGSIRIPIFLEQRSNLWKTSTEVPFSLWRNFQFIVWQSFTTIRVNLDKDKTWFPRGLGLELRDGDWDISGSPDFLRIFFGKEEEPISFDKTYVGKQDIFPGCLYIDIPRRDVRRWMLALRYRSQPDHEQVYFEQLDPEQSDPEQPNTLDLEFLVDRISNWPRFRGFLRDWVLYLGFGITGIVYGGLHCAAWSAPFSTHLEAVLWRVSSVAVSATGFLISLLYCWERSNPWKDWTVPIQWVAGKSGYAWLVDWADEAFDEYFVLDVISLILVMLVMLIFLIIRAAFDMFVLACVVLYFLARAFLVVECFINIRHLPDSAYQMPQWTQYLPSIS